MKITLCGSITFLEKIYEIGKELESLGHEVLLPDSAARGQVADFWVEMKKDKEKYLAYKSEKIRDHFTKIKEGDAILVINEDKHGVAGYIGPNTLMEVGLAWDLGKKIFILHPLSEDINCREEIESLFPVFLEGDIFSLH
jgi:hypothetical protein